jgi:hypothetical protein
LSPNWLHFYIPIYAAQWQTKSIKPFSLVKTNGEMLLYEASYDFGLGQRVLREKQRKIYRLGLSWDSMRTRACKKTARL